MMHATSKIEVSCKDENFNCRQKFSKSRVTFGRTCNLSVQRHRANRFERLTVGELFSQSPQSLVEADF